MTMNLFFIGVLEMIIVSFWTKAVTETKMLMSGAITLVNVLIWYYVLQAIVNDVSNWVLVAAYSVGCAVGTMLSVAMFRWRDNKKESVATLKNERQSSTI